MSIEHLPTPITRVEKQLAALSGMDAGTLPIPVTRIEKFLAYLIENGVGTGSGSSVSPEQITQAIANYIELHPDVFEKNVKMLAQITDISEQSSLTIKMDDDSNPLDLSEIWIKVVYPAGTDEQSNVRPYVICSDGTLSENCPYYIGNIAANSSAESSGWLFNAKMMGDKFIVMSYSYSPNNKNFGSNLYRNAGYFSRYPKITGIGGISVVEGAEVYVFGR